MEWCGLGRGERPLLRFRLGDRVCSSASDQTRPKHKKESYGQQHRTDVGELIIYSSPSAWRASALVSALRHMATPRTKVHVCEANVPLP